MLSITRNGSTVAVTQRLFTDALKAAAEATVEQWHQTMLPRHFTEEGFDLYGYQPRKGQGQPSLIYSDAGTAVRQGKYGRLINNPNYYWIKWRRFKTHDPLVYTGRSRRQAEQSIRVSARATNRGANIQGQGVLDLPTYFYQYNKSYGAPDKADELFRTTPQEDVELTDFYNDSVGRHLAAASAPATSQRIA